MNVKLEGGWPQPFAYWAWEGDPEHDSGKYAEVQVVPADIAQELAEELEQAERRIHDEWGFGPFIPSNALTRYKREVG